MYLHLKWTRTHLSTFFKSWASWLPEWPPNYAYLSPGLPTPACVQAYKTTKVWKLSDNWKRGRALPYSGGYRKCFCPSRNTRTKAASLLEKLLVWFPVIFLEWKDTLPSSWEGPAIKDCIVYFVARFVARRFRQTSGSTVCQNALGDTSAPAWKDSRNRSHQVASLPNLPKHSFVHSPSISRELLSHMYSKCLRRDFRPCPSDSKADFSVMLLTGILHCYVGMRMRQFYKHVNNAVKKLAQEKKVATPFLVSFPKCEDLNKNRRCQEMSSKH